MSREDQIRPRRSGVRGPTSALSSFLRERGITVPTNPYQRINETDAVFQENETSEVAESSQAHDVDTVIEISDNAHQANSTNEKGALKIQNKRQRSFPKKNESDQDDDVPNSKRSKFTQRKKTNDDIANMMDFCISCHRRFINPQKVQGQCEACETVRGKLKRAKSTKKAIKKAQELVLEVTGELGGLILPLRDMCLRVLSKHIADIEHLGFIEPRTKQRFARIISRKRQLNNSTISLFLGPYEDEVHLYDCSLIDPDGLSLIPLQCHNLRVLDLGLVGQMNDSVLNLMAERCTLLEHLSFNGAFLCTEAAFCGLFEKLIHLKVLKLCFAAKLSNKCLETISNSCPNLQQLLIDDSPLISDSGVLELQALTNLSSLTLNSINSLDLSTLEIVFSKLGGNLTQLSLNKHSNLPADALNIINHFCPNLKDLSLENCPELTSDTSKLVDLFSNLKPLNTLSLAGNVAIENDALLAISNIHFETLEKLNINGLDELSIVSLENVCTKFKRLKEIDVSWIRSFDDPLLNLLLTNSPDLKLVKLFGCHQLSNCVLDKEWRNLHGERIVFLGNEFD